MQLDPPFLGRIMITLTLNETGTMTARITAANQYVSDLLASQAINLQNALRETGINMENIDIMYSALNQDGSGGRDNEPQNETSAAESEFDFGLTEVDLDNVMLNGLTV